MPPENNNKKIFIIIVSIIVALLLILTTGTSLYFYNKYQKAQDSLKNPATGTNLEAETILQKVGKLIELPTGETPTIITITDIDKVKNQPFFAKAKNGDKVIIYKQAQRAILYDPVENKVLEVGPLIIPTGTISPTSQKGTTPLPTLKSPSSATTSSPTQVPLDLKQ